MPFLLFKSTRERLFCSDMNILIISANQTTLPVPVLPAGACMIAEACERAGYVVTLLDMMFSADPCRQIKETLAELRYDVVGISVRNIDNIIMGEPTSFIPQLMKMVQIIQEMTEVPIVLGGPAVAIMPEEILRVTNASCVVSSDGESTFLELVHKISRKEPWKNVNGIGWLENGRYRANPELKQNAFSFQPVDYTAWVDIKKYQSYLSTVAMQSKQGCTFDCVYCTYRKIEGSDHRLAEPQELADVARYFVSSGLRDIEFTDTVFNHPYDHAFRVCESMLQKGVRARFQSLDMNPAFLDDKLLRVMKRSNFSGIGITVESSCDTVLKNLRKSFGSAEVYKAAETVKKHRIPCLWIFLLGGPGETKETVRQTLRFAEKYIRRGDAALFNIGLRVYPGTELERMARAEGMLTASSIEMLAPVYYLSPEVQADWIVEQVKIATQQNYNFLDGNVMSSHYLPKISRIGHRLGLKPPLWRYTRFIRRGLSVMGKQI